MKHLDLWEELWVPEIYTSNRGWSTTGGEFENTGVPKGLLSAVSQKGVQWTLRRKRLWLPGRWQLLSLYILFPISLGLKSKQDSAEAQYAVWNAHDVSVTCRKSKRALLDWICIHSLCLVTSPDCLSASWSLPQCAGVIFSWSHSPHEACVIYTPQLIGDLETGESAVIVIDSCHWVVPKISHATLVAPESPSIPLVFHWGCLSQWRDQEVSRKGLVKY